ncbi:zinc finger protein 583 [Esox lucius]|uniref:zinc finger protein 583 n=1 Tax=Esox lucius TaxID=8010 RepID=UPI00147753BE|nr:zinc finger protein 583 [Esox lucius]
MSRERETLLDEIELSLYTLTDDNLRYLCKSCGIGGKDGSEVKGKSQRSLRRIIGEYCENVNLIDPDDQGISRLLQLKEDIKRIQKDASCMPTRTSLSATTVLGTTQISCDTEQNKEGGVWMPNSRKSTEPAPKWLIVTEQTVPLGPESDCGARKIRRDAKVLLEDCRSVLGQRFDIKVEDDEERISGFANEGDCPPDSRHSRSREQHQEADKGKRSLHRPQRKKRCTKRDHPKPQPHSEKTSSHCSDSDEDLSLSSYQCPECKKRFSSNAGLQKHTRIHSGERLFQCSHCDKSFINSSNLHQHLPVHSREKPHHCSDCGRTFSTARYLTKHKRLHSGIKPFCCIHCDKRYTRSDQLKVHMMTHTGRFEAHSPILLKLIWTLSKDSEHNPAVFIDPPVI